MTNIHNVRIAIHFYRPQRSCGQGNIFTPVCHSVHRGGSASVHAAMPPPTKETPPSCQGDPPKGGTPTEGGPPKKEAPPRRRPPWKEIPWKDTPWEGDALGRRHPPKKEAPLQVHTQGGNCRGSGPGPHPRGN